MYSVDLGKDTAPLPVRYRRISFEKNKKKGMREVRENVKAKRNKDVKDFVKMER
jgi:hypothetical protein